MKKRVIAIILVMTLVWSSLGDVFRGISFAALAEEPEPATPTDLTCLHENRKTTVYFLDGASYTPIDSDTHRISGRAMIETVCLEEGCNKVIEKRELEYAEETRTHSIREGVCSLCGYSAVTEKRSPEMLTQYAGSETGDNNQNKEPKPNTGDDNSKNGTDPEPDIADAYLNKDSEPNTGDGNLKKSIDPEPDTADANLNNGSESDAKNDNQNKDPEPNTGDDNLKKGDNPEPKDGEENLKKGPEPDAGAGNQDGSGETGQGEEEKEQKDEMAIFAAAAPKSAASDTPAMLGASNPAINEIPYLQKLINDALSATLKGRITVELAKNTTYEGDVTIKADAKSVSEDFELELRAEDAGFDGISGNGYTTINGNIVIMGLRVILNSIIMAKDTLITVKNAGDTSGEQSGRGGELEYNGTTNFNNEVAVDVGSNSTAELNFGDTNDKIKIKTEAGAKAVTVNAGNGINTVSAQINGGDVKIETGKDADTVSVETSGSKLGNIDVKTGAAIDELKIQHDGSATEGKTVQFNTGAGDDRVTVDVRENSGDITVDTGLGGDVVTVAKGNHHVFETVEYNRFNNPNEKFRAESDTSTLTFVNSDDTAFDQFTIDVNAAGAVHTIAFKGGKGASVNLRGTLKTDPQDGTHQPIRWTGDDHSGIELDALMTSAMTAGERDLTLTLKWQQNAENGKSAPAYNFTDALKNKRQVRLWAFGVEIGGERTFSYGGATEDFTDYVIQTPVNKLDSISITGSDKPLMLSNLLIDTDLTQDAYIDTFLQDEDIGDDNGILAMYGYLRVPNIDAANLNVLLRSNTVQLKSGRHINAQNVRLEAISGTKTMGQAFGNLTARTTDGYNALEVLRDKSVAVGETVTDMFTLYNRSKININGTINAEHNIEMLAKVKQFGNILGFWPSSLNAINVKIGDAEIEINENAKLKAKDNVIADAKVETITGMEYAEADDGSGNLKQVKSGSPVEITFVVNQAEINVKNGAEIEGEKGDVTLNAESKVTTGDYAFLGAFTSPFAASVAAVFNYVKTDVDGKVTAGRKAEVRARGDVKVEAEVIKDQAYDSASGYFGAISFLDQDVQARYGENAVVTAGQDVRADSKATADIDTLATAGGTEQTSSAMGNSIASLFVDTLIPLLSEKLGLTLKIDKLQKAVAKIAAGSYEVKVVNPSAEQEEWGSASVTTYIDKTRVLENDYIEAIVEVNPKEGYTVDSVMYRYLVPGEDHYTYENAKRIRYTDVQDGEENKIALMYLIKPTQKYTEVIVNFRNSEQIQQDEETYAIKKNDLENVIAFGRLVDEAMDQKLKNEYQELKPEDLNEDQQHPLRFNTEGGGKVVTWLAGKDKKSLASVQEGQVIRLVPNPEEGKKLEAMTFTYTTRDGITATCGIPADDGIYHFTVPTDIEAGTRITVNARFTAGEGEEQPPDTKQTTGSIALTWAMNESGAVIDKGAAIKAENGNVELISSKTTDVNTVADGTAVTDNAAPKKEKEEPQEKLFPQTEHFSVGEALYAIKLTSNVNGAVTGTIDRNKGANALMPVFTITPPVGADITKTKVVLTYYSEIETNPFGGTLRSQEFSGSDFTHDGDGNYKLKANLNATTILNGEVMDVSFLFVDSNGNPLNSEQGGNSEWLIRNPIATQVNELRKRNANGQYETAPGDDHSVGELYYAGQDTIDGKKVYTFRLAKQTGTDYKGYTINDRFDVASNRSDKSVLCAVWFDENGVKQTMALKHQEVIDPVTGSSYWYLDPTDSNNYIPEGAQITVVAMFREDTRKIEEKPRIGDDGQPLDQGKTVFRQTEAKYGDKVQVKLEPKDGLIPSYILIRWVSGDSTNSATYGQVQWKTIDTLNADGEFEFDMPWITDSGTLEVEAHYTTKNVGLTAEGGLQLSEKGKGYAGETITVKPSKDDEKAGKKVTKVTVAYTYENGTTVEKTYNSDSFTIEANDGASPTKSVTVRAEMASKKYQLDEVTDEYGKFVPKVSWADPGEKVQIEVKAQDGYRAKFGTLKAHYRTGSSSGEIRLKRVGPNLYEFTVPNASDIKTLYITGEFEPGSDDIERSLGVSIAGAMIIADNTTEIKEGAKVTAGKDLIMTGLSNGNKATTEAHAGFSAAATGFAGGLAVHGAIFDNDVRIHKDAILSIGGGNEDGGALSLLAKSSATFKVIGNASGNRSDNGGTGKGTGSGIAIGVNFITTNAVVEDKVKLDTMNSKFSSISVNSSHKTKDTVKATAGAKGGTSLVPVVAADIFSSEAKAELGRFKQGAFVNKEFVGSVVEAPLNVSGKVTVKAKSESAQVAYNHEVTADAKTTGNQSAKGIALLVTWLQTDVNARLKQSVNAGDSVSVSAVATDALKATANASAAGGYDGKRGQNGKGSADQQANGMLGNAANIAAMGGRADAAANIAGDANNRQQAETSETTVTGAGALILNIQKNKSKAEIADDVDVTTAAKLTVQSQNRTEAKVVANASAVKSDTGLGIGVAINIVRMDNIARIGAGQMTAGELLVEAALAEMPPEIRTMKMTQAVGSGTMQSELEATLEELFRDLVGDKVYETIGSGINKFISTFWAGLVRDLNLQQLMDIRDDKGTAGLYSAFDVMKNRILEIPEMLAAPYTKTFKQIMEGVEGFNAEDFADFLKSELTTQLAGKGYQAFLKYFWKESSDGIIGAAIDLLSNKIKGKEGGGDIVTGKLKAAAEKAFRGWIDDFMDDFQVKMAAQFPVLNESNKEAVKKLVRDIKNLSVKDMGRKLADQLLGTFRREIYDYEPVMTQIQSKGFLDFVKDEAIKLLKESAAAMTNEMLDSLAGKMNVKFDRVEVYDRHVITTQAIAGAGASGKSQAGSVAVSVANLTTKAEIKKSDNTITVNNDGALTMNAEEKRQVWTHATAAVDARTGEANNNDGKGEAENRENGGAAAGGQTLTSEDGVVAVKAGVGGTIRYADNGTDLYLEHLQPGYDSVKVRRTYVLEDGTEVVDNIEPEKYYDDYVMDPTDGIDVYQLKDGTQVEIEVEFVANMRTVPAVTLFNENAYVQHKGSVTVCVEGDEKPQNTTKAKTGDLVEIHVKNVGGLWADNIRVYERDNDDPVCEYDRDEAENVTLRVAYSNDEETVYVFKMPEGDIDRINVNFTGEYDPNASKAGSTNAAGESVGRGGAFAWTWGDSTVKAEIGKRGTGEIPKGKTEADPGVTAGSIAVTAYSEHREQNFSTAGTDPFEGTSSIKDSGLDVALSLNMLDNDIKATIAEGMRIVTTGTPETGEDGEEEEVSEKDLKASAGDLLIHATEYSENETRASAFATGDNSAIGASVAANISLSDVNAELGSDATVTGEAAIRSFSESQDRTWSFASAMGADVQRALNKAAEFTEDLEKTASGVADGSFNNEMAKKNDKKKNTNSGNQIADRLNQDRAEGGQEAAGNLNVGANIARVANVQIDNAEEADGEEGRGRAEQLAQDHGVNAPTEGTGQGKKRLQAAAAIGFTLAKHNTKVKVTGSVNAAQDIDISTMNAGNFNTRATSASITLADMGKGKSISAAIGVSISKNKSTIDIGDEEKNKKANLVSANGNVTVDAELTQNQTGVFRGYLAVQSISGAVSGKNASGSVAGAVSSVFSWAETAARVNSKETKLEGDEVTIRANDKTKLAARAGSVNVSKGASVGAGVSVATIWSGNTVETFLNDSSTVTANSFDMTAQKEKVTFSDYKFPLTLSALISDSSELTPEQRENATTGLVDIHKDPGKSTYTVDININTYTLMQLPDMWNFLASQNYYTEAIAGSVITGGNNNDFNAAGSFSIVRAKNKVNAILGDSVTINRKTEGQTDGKVNISSRGDTTARMLGGAVAVGAAKTTAGVTVTFLYDEDKVNTEIGDKLTIQDAGDVNISSKGGAHVQTFNAAAAVATSYNAKVAVGGALNVLILKNIASTDIGKTSDISANGSLDITSDSDMDLTLISVSAAGSAHGNAGGGTVAFVFDTAKAKVHMGSGQTLKAGKDITLRGKASDDVLSILPSAAGSGKGNAIAGVLNVLDSETKGIVELDAGSGGIESTGGSINFIGKTDTRAINITLAGAGSGTGNAVGLSVNLNFFGRESKVDIGGGSTYTIKSAKDILSVASGDDTTVMVSAAVTGGSGSGISLSGNAAVVVGKNQITNTLGNAKVTAAGEAAFASHLRDRAYLVQGNVAVAAGGSGVGAAYMFLLKENVVHTDLGDSTINAIGRAGTLAKKVPGIGEFEGLYVGARVQDTIIAVTAGVAYGSELGVTANLLTANNYNEVKVIAEDATLMAKSLADKDGDGKMEETGEGGSVLVEAKNDSSNVLIMGGINASMAVAGGAGIQTLYAKKNVSAKVGTIKADQNVDVNAVNKENLVQLNIAAGGAGTAAAEVAIVLQVLGSSAKAIVAGDVRAEYGEFNLTSHNDVDIVNATIAGGGAGAVAVSPVAVLQFFSGSSEAYLQEGNVYAPLGVNVEATSDKTIDQYTIGVAGSGLVAVAGGVTIQSIKDSTKAAVGQDVVVERANSMSVHGKSNYSLIGVSGLAAAATVGGVAVNVMLTIMKANTLAEMEGTATLTGGALEVRATSNRSILDIGATLSGGAVGVGITLAGLVSGTKMDQDEANMMVYGDTKDNGKTTFSTSGVAKMLKDTRKQFGLKEKYMGTQEIEGTPDNEGNMTGGLGADLEGNSDNKNTQMNIGSNGTFDAQGAAVDASAYDQRGAADETMTDGSHEDDETPVDDKLADGGLGEEDDVEETADLKNARELGGSVYNKMPDDAVIARIGSNAKILNAHGVAVEAIQGTEADIAAGTVSASLLGGGASGAAFALLHSNVSASSEGELQDVNGGEVRIKAISAAGRVNESEAGFTHSKAEALAGGFSSDYNKKNRDEALSAQIHQGDKDDDDDILDGHKAEDQEEKEDNSRGDVSVSGSMLRVIGISAAVEGMPDIENDSYGGAVILGVLRSDNVTQATLGNQVANAGLVNVNAVADYKNIFAFTLGAHVNIAGSKGANSVSIATATSEGTVTAKIDESAYISGTGTEVNVTTDSDTTVMSIAATVGLSLSAGGGEDGDEPLADPTKNGGLSIAINKLSQNTVIERGASIEAQNGNVTVKAVSDTTANAYLISGHGSAGRAAGMNGAIVYVRPNIKTTVGVEGDGPAATSLKKLNDVTVKNIVSSEADVGVLSLSVGLGGSFQGNALLVFNDTDALAKVANTTLDVQNLTIKSDLGAEGDSKMLAIVAGKAAVGISVAYVDVSSKSSAELDTSKVTGKIKDTLTVESGTAGKKTKALALGIAAQVGYYAAGGINVTLAKNSAENNAAIYGSATALNAATVNVNAKSDATTRTRMYGLSLSTYATIAATAESVKNEATSRATVNLENGTINGDLNISSQTTGSTKAYMLTGSGSLVGVDTNVAIAHGKTRSLVDVTMGKAPLSGKYAINATNTGNKDDLKVDINNISVHALTVAVMVGLGYSQDIYRTRIRLSGNHKLKELKAQTDYDTDTHVEVTPAAAGVTLAVMNVSVNIAKAKNTVYAGSEVQFTNMLVSDDATEDEKAVAAAKAATKAKNKVTIDGELDILTTGTGNVKSNVRTPAVSITVGNVSVSVSHATMSARQAALLELSGVNMTVGKALKVQSISKGVDSTARVGGMGPADGEAGLEVSFAKVGVNSAKAWENLESTAGIIGTGKSRDTITALTMDIRTENVGEETTKAYARTTNGAELAINSGGGLLAQAISSDSYNAILKGVAATIKGKVYITAKTNAVAEASGEEPGGLTGDKVNYSEMKAFLGDKNDKQTAKVLIGDDTDLTTQGTDSDIFIEAENKGNVKAVMDGGINISLITSVQVSKMPTTSWYDTGVLIGKNSVITSSGKAAVFSTTNSAATSDMDAATFVGGINAQHMQGKNSIHDSNWITLGEKSKLIAQNNVTIKGVSNTQAQATSDFDGGAILSAGERLLSENQIKRDVIVSIAKGAQINSKAGDVDIESITGEEDWILTAATVGSGSLINFSRTVVTVGLEANNEIHVASNAQIDAAKDLYIIARASGKQTPGVNLPTKFGKIDGAGIYSYASSTGSGLINPVYGITEMTMKLKTLISINRDATGETTKTALKSNSGNVSIMASNNDLNVKAEGKSHAYGLGGNSTAKAGIDTDIMNSIYLDNVELGGKIVRILAGYEIYDNPEKQTQKPVFTTYSNSLLGEIGRVKSQSNINGFYHNQIRTNNPNFIDANAIEFIHKAYNPMDIVQVKQTMNITGPLGLEKVEEKELDWKDLVGHATYRCDLCLEGMSRDVGYRDLSDGLAASFAKAMIPVIEIDRKANDVGITRARYGDEEYAAASKLFVLDLYSMLDRDVTIGKDALKKYRLWTSGRTGHGVYMLPNATRLYTNARDRLQYVSETMTGDVLDDGVIRSIEIITALTKNAFSNPVFPIGSTGQLDFRTGMLKLPSGADFELYLDEVSAAWMTEKLNSGFIRRLDADQTELNDAALNGSDLPTGRIVEGLTAGGENEGWEIYWLGATPETAEDPDQTLLFLLANPETDEIDAFRTSVNMIANGEDPVDVSLYLYRDSSSDRMGEEKYNCLFFDTPEGQKSIVKVVTDVLMGRKLELPRPLDIVLRAFNLDNDGADLKGYAVSGMFFAMNDGTDGEVNMFDGAYEATLANDVFESPFIRIEGVSTGDPQVTLKEGQPVWPEWTGEDTAQDAAGKEFVLVDEVWYPKGEEPVSANLDTEDDAA